METRYNSKLIPQIENSFTYHAPKGNQAARYAILRDIAKELALAILDMTPPSREQSTAITRLEEAVMWANKAIACNESACNEKGEE